MAQEQQIVPGDFLGLSKSNVEGVGENDGENEREHGKTGNQAVATIGSAGAISCQHLQATDSSPPGRQRTGTGGDFSNDDLGEDGPVGGPANVIITTPGSPALRGDAVGDGGAASENGMSDFVNVPTVGENVNRSRPGFTSILPGNALGSSSGKVEEVMKSNDTEKITMSGKALEDLTDADIGQLTGEECGLSLKERGHPSWNKAAVIQQVLTHQNLHEKRSNGKCGPSLDEQLTSYAYLPSEVQCGINLNQWNSGCGQHSVCSGRNIFNGNGCPPFKDSGFCDNNETESQSAVHTRQSGVTKEQSSSTRPVDHVGAVPNSAICLSISKKHLLSSPDLIGQLGSVPSASPPMPRAVGSVPLSGSLLTPPMVVGTPALTQTRQISSNALGRQTCAQLTIFYAGTVNVYDNVPVDKVRDIMLLAESSTVKITNSPASVHALSTSNAVTSSLSRPASPTRYPPVPCPLRSINTQHKPQKMQPNMQTSQTTLSIQPTVDSSQGISVPAVNKQQELSKLKVPLSTSSVLSPCQSVVPRALPVARKASLARFLEKRKERVRLMAPYPSKDFSPDLMLRKGETMSSSKGGIPFCARSSDSCTEEKLRNIRNASDDGAVKMLQNSATCEMDVEDQNWLKTTDKPKHAMEVETASQFSTSCS